MIDCSLQWTTPWNKVILDCSSIKANVAVLVLAYSQRKKFTTSLLNGLLNEQRRELLVTHLTASSSKVLRLAYAFCRVRQRYRWLTRYGWLTTAFVRVGSCTEYPQLQPMCRSVYDIQKFVLLFLLHRRCLFERLVRTSLLAVENFGANASDEVHLFD